MPPYTSERRTISRVKTTIGFVDTAARCDDAFDSQPDINMPSECAGSKDIETAEVIIGDSADGMTGLGCATKCDRFSLLGL